MLCSKCYKEIKQGKEAHIESLRICEECARKITIDCYTCGDKIPYNKTIHKSSRSWSKGFNIWLFFAREENSEEVIQCDWCYQEWKVRIKRWEKGLKLLEKLIGLCILVIIGWTLYLFYPDKMEKIKKSHLVFFIPLVISFVVIFSLIATFLDIGRYKDMKEIRKKEKNKNKAKCNKK